MPDTSLRIYNGATAVVTGGASGIGRALGVELARRGCEIFLADQQLDMAEEAAAAIRSSGGKARAYGLDVVDFAAFEGLLHRVFEQTGRLDYLFNNAGIAIGGPIHLHDIRDWNRIIDVNLRGVVNGVQAGYPIMLRQGFGHIVNTASLAGLVSAGLGTVAYATVKHAVVALSTGLRAEAGAIGIRVSVLCPGAVRTPILIDGGVHGKIYGDVTPEQQREMWERYHPMPADLFAAKALDGIARNRSIIVIPAKWKRFWWLDRLSPSLLVFLVQKEYQREIRKKGRPATSS